ncbi:uncharacterized protein LOC110981813 [Acanthaster planci]|uniref:Uncharacterized protein LOC110981813 n=1 Tax=Acanthaster planci TaxID=133434 RepID=A0A8B7YRY3_ACAPL|nr:uncharacterized protein LOC110981813 [Acanthaster planci]
MMERVSRLDSVEVQTLSLYRLTINEILEKFKDGSLTCEDYMNRVIRRATELKAFNYFISMDTDRMMDDAKEADARYRRKTHRHLEGIPIAVKDNIDIEGEVTGAGTSGLAGRRAKRTAEVVRRLLAAGAINAGRTNMHEMACGITSANLYTGACHNFFNYDFSCGGSSGGSGGAVGADIVPVALGTDTGGSIRVPASFNGIFGLRPSIGRWPADFGVKFTHLKDSVGPLVRSAKDIAILDSVMTGEEVYRDLAPSEIRIGVPKSHFWEDLDPEVQTYATECLEVLRDQGFTIVADGEIPGVGEFQRKYKFLTNKKEAVLRLEEWLQLHKHDVSPEAIVDVIACPRVRSIFQDALRNPPSEEEYGRALKARDDLLRNLQEYFQDQRVDCILMPATKIAPQRLDILDSDPVPGREAGESLILTVTSNSDFANVCDHPSLVIPGGLSRAGGVPFGLQIDGRRGMDQKLIAVGITIQRALKIQAVFEPATIRDQFVYSRFIMLKTFLSALTTSIICFCLLAALPPTRKYFLQIRQGYLACLTRKGALMSVSGGVVLGAGMALCASCPGIVLAQIGASVPNAGYTLLGCFAGVLLYALTESSVRNLFASSLRKPQTVDHYLGIPYPLLGVTTATLTSSVVFIFESLFPWQTQYEGWNAGPGESLLAVRAWPPYMSGILIGLLQVPVIFTVGDTVGGSQSYCTMLSQLCVSRTLEEKMPYLTQYKRGIDNWWQVLFVIGAVGGACISAASSSSLGAAGGITPTAAFVGGVLMLYGARMAGGCTSGHGLSGFGLMMALSAVTVPAMFAGGTAMGFFIRYLGNVS